tara:strand:- start:3030 stop:4688 length:1659 start_codon:yes stop_codon:yes gene_type:complete
MTSVLFISFHILLYLLGRGFVLALSKIIKLKFGIENTFIGNLGINYYYPIIALFVIGNLTVFINFFSPVNTIYIKILFVIFLSINLLDLKFVFDRDYVVNLGIIPFILSISSYGINIAQDAGLYHLNVQSWIREEKIHFGLSNIHSRYGYSSLFDYISSNFWLDNNFLLIHFINLTFIVLFFAFIYKNLFLKENVFLKNLSILVIIFGILDNLGLSGGKNGFIDIEAVTKYDTPFAIIYFITGCLIINNIFNSDYEILPLTIILYLLIFAIQLRIFGVTLIPLFLILSGRVLKKYGLIKLLRPALVPVVFIFLWIIKNILITSCLFFPVEELCFQSLPWSDVSSAGIESGDLKNFHIFFSLDQNFGSWLNSWLSKPINYTTSINYLISTLFLVLFNFVIYKKSPTRKKSFDYLLVLLCIATSYLVWILSAPGIRFGLGLFLLSLSLISIQYNGSQERLSLNDNLKNITLRFLFLVCILLVTRLDAYSSFSDSFEKTIQITPTNISYIDNPLGWGVIPEDAKSSCWVNIECMPESRRISKVTGRYNYFVNLDS